MTLLDRKSKGKRKKSLTYENVNKLLEAKKKFLTLFETKYFQEKSKLKKQE